ncbi:hypothetical protein JHK85_008341 [Glycine max]|uniref:Uncharacterized protein n=1 Tax=Glycine soja TaxID=3848 RepID=A0A445LEV1_GLYSO|nr:hypothetical protein JHK87_007946 [Glycine soja]KAG5055831.1 hypothetical protein JHK85_008341 [Glycine max]KAG5072888.1 hypothetical protein JHK86_008099 [Glycine max]RZC21704.1 hypothetical protein D0Y65_007780 [Glycine soja]
MDHSVNEIVLFSAGTVPECAFAFYDLISRCSGMLSALFPSIHASFSSISSSHLFRFIYLSSFQSSTLDVPLNV